MRFISENPFWNHHKESFRESVPSTILFVTAFKDIGRGYWKSSSRSVDQYIHWFLSLASRITYPLVVYIEPVIKSQLPLSTISPTVSFVDLNEVDCFLNRYSHREKEIILHPSFQKHIPPERKELPETNIPEYNLINHSKINFVRDASDRFPQYDYYSWVDFGMFRDIEMIPKALKIESFPTNTFIFHCLSQPEGRISEWDMLKTNRVFITGSTFILQKENIKEYESLYDTKLKEWQKKGISDDDQSLILQLWFDQPSRFKLYESKDWFSLFHLVPHD